VTNVVAVNSGASDAMDELAMANISFWHVYLIMMMMMMMMMIMMMIMMIIMMMIMMMMFT
jgi:hypothetical protein